MFPCVLLTVLETNGKRRDFPWCGGLGGYFGCAGKGSDYVDSQVWPISQCEAFLTMVFALGKSNSSII